MGALRRYDDFRTVVVEYAAEAAWHGAVYLEAIFSPGLWRRLDQDEVFGGYCDGAQEARELHDLDVRLTPDLPGVYSPEQAEKVATVAGKYRERGVVGLGLVGAADDHAMQPFARAFAIAREAGLGVVPHAGEVAGPESVRAALDVLAADRIRHGIRAEEDPGLVRELASRGTVLDVCPISNLRLGVGRVAAGSSAAAPGCRGRALLDLDRRSGDLRHRPHARLRRCDLVRACPTRALRRRCRRRALRRRHARTSPRHRRIVRMALINGCRCRRSE
jgi:adenosine deaminase